MRRISLAVLVLLVGCMPQLTYTGNIYPERGTQQQFNEDNYRCQMQATATQQAYFPVINLNNVMMASDVYNDTYKGCMANFGWRTGK